MFIHGSLPHARAVLGIENIAVSKPDPRSHRDLGEVLLTEGTGYCKDMLAGTYPSCSRISQGMKVAGVREKEERDESET